MRSTKILSSALCFILLGAAAAQAAIITSGVTASLDGRRGGSSVSVTLASTPYSTGPANAGLFFWSAQTPNVPDLVDVTGTPRNGSFPGGALASGASSFVSFCLELTQTISVGSPYAGLNIVTADSAPVPGTGGLSPMGARGENYLASLAGKFLASALQASDSIAAGTYTLSERIGAFQIAAWKLSYDGNNATYANRFSLSSGNLTAAASATTTLAQVWLNAVKAADVGNDGLNPLPGAFRPVYGLQKAPASSVNFQDQLVFEAGSFADVPEPTTLAMWAAGGAIGLVLSQRRRRS